MKSKAFIGIALYNTQKLKSKFVVSNLAGLKTMKSLKRVVKVSKEEWKHGEISKSPIANFEKILNRKSNSTDVQKKVTHLI